MTATAVLADTHAIVWYLSESPQLSATALNALDQAVQAGTYIYVAAITMVELALRRSLWLNWHISSNEKS